VKRILTALHQDARGTTSIEYALICGLIFLAIVGAVRGLGDKNGGIWADFSNKSKAAMSTAS
jgi:Flp pilus assembly pilin Flp